MFGQSRNKLNQYISIFVIKIIQNRNSIQINYLNVGLALSKRQGALWLTSSAFTQLPVQARYREIFGA